MAIIEKLAALGKCKGSTAAEKIKGVLVMTNNKKR